MWSIAVCGAETGTFQKVDQKYLGSFEVRCWRRIEKISWTDLVGNEKMLLRVRVERNIIHTVKRGKANWIGYSWRINCLLKHVIE
jgi:hypothetical protein